VAVIQLWIVRQLNYSMSEKFKMRDGDTMLIMAKDGAILHFSPNMSWPHVEFVRRMTGKLPDGAWVGTVSKLDGEIAAISSKYFFWLSTSRTRLGSDRSKKQI
jgi:hypothetical protein